MIIQNTDWTHEYDEEKDTWKKINIPIKIIWNYQIYKNDLYDIETKK